MTKQPSLASEKQQQKQQSLSDAVKDGWNSLRYRLSFRNARLIGNNANSRLANSPNRRFLRLRKSLSIWLLGNEYSVANEVASECLAQDLSQLIHLSYRRGIQPAMVSADTGRVYRTDAGWGCMYRCVQMLLATALSRAARLTSSAAPLDIELFADDGPLSLAALLAGAGKEPGDWSGPATACRAALSAVSSVNCGGGADSLVGRLRVHLANDSCVCRDRLVSAWLPTVADHHDHDEATSANESSVFYEDQSPLLLLLLPLRLGGSALAHSDHLAALQSLLRQPTCLGLLGGRPRRSLYFCGYQGDRLLGLDPHDRCVRDWRAQLRNNRPRFVSYRRLDPSCAVGFLLGSRAEMDRLLTCLETECRGLACVIQSARDLWPPSGVTITSLSVSEPGSCYADVGRQQQDGRMKDGEDDDDGITVGASASDYFQLSGGPVKTGQSRGHRRRSERDEEWDDEAGRQLDQRYECDSWKRDSLEVAESDTSDFDFVLI